MSGADSGTVGRIVLVDDDVEFLDELSDYLSRSGFVVSVCHRPALAGRYLRFMQPEAVLLDFDMPGVSGLQILQQLRARSETRSTPVLLLTAHDQPEIRVGGWSHQLDDFIPKGTDRVEIRMRLTRAVERNRENRTHEQSTGLPAGPTGRAQLAAALAAGFARDASPNFAADLEGTAVSGHRGDDAVDVDGTDDMRSVFVLRLPGFDLFPRGDRPELVDAFRRCFRAVAHRLRDVLGPAASAWEAGPDSVIYCGPQARPADVLQHAVLRRRVRAANRLLRRWSGGGASEFLAARDGRLTRHAMPSFRLEEFRFFGSREFDLDEFLSLAEDFLAEPAPASGFQIHQL